MNQEEKWPVEQGGDVFHNGDLLQHQKFFTRGRVIRFEQDENNRMIVVIKTPGGFEQGDLAENWIKIEGKE